MPQFFNLQDCFTRVCLFHTQAIMKPKIMRFLQDDCGAGLVEYTLLLAFVMVTIMGLATGYHGSIAGVAGVTNWNLTAAASVAK